MKNFIWNEEKIKDGFEKFFNEHGRYPTTLEIDNYTYLPSSKLLQRRFGGVKKVRELLQLPIIDFAMGPARRETAFMIGVRGADIERKINEILKGHFGEICVHEQKPYGSRGRLDFFIYAKKFKFGVDVFYPKDYHSFVGCLNFKEKTYKDTDFRIVLLQMNPSITQNQINDFILNKKKTINQRLECHGYSHFISFIKQIEPLNVSS